MRDGGHRRRARAGARGRGRPDAALPDQDAHAVGRLDVRELDVGAGRKSRVRRQRGAEPIEARRRPAARRPAPRTADCPCRACVTSSDSPATSSVSCADVGRAGPSPRETYSAPPLRRHERQRFPARHRCRRAPRSSGRLAGRCALVQHERREAAQAVAGQLRRAAVGVDTASCAPCRRARPCRGSGRRRRRRCDARTGARASAVRIEALGLVVRDEQKVVAVGVRFGERQLSHHGTRNALKTQVNPA